MLELTNYQIFFMILHGCLLLFAFAYMFRGNSPSKNKKIVSYKEFQRQKHRKSSKRRAAQSSQNTRQVREVRDIYAAVSGEDYNPIPKMIEQQSVNSPPRLLAAPLEDTLTHFTLTDIDFDID